MDRRLAEALLEVKSYREFLRLFFDPPEGAKLKTKWTYELFARRAQFASKSFIYQVIQGKKRLTLDSAEKAITALSLTRPWAEYFRLLVSLETAGVSERLSEQVAKRKSALRKGLEVKHRDTDVRKIPANMLNLAGIIYASLGDPVKGATLSEIAKRSRLSTDKVSEVLERLVEVGLAEPASNSRYRANTQNVEALGLGGSEQFENDMKAACKTLVERLQSRKSNDKSLFYLNTFSVREKDLPALKAALSAAVSNFVVESEVAEGDCLAEIVVGLTSNS